MNWRGVLRRGLIAERCRHERARLIPEGNINGLDLIAVVCTTCGAVVDEFERTTLLDEL